MGHKFFFVIYFCKNLHTRRLDQDLESDQQMDCSHTSQLSIRSKIVLYGHLERKLCLTYFILWRDDGKQLHFLFFLALHYFIF